MLIEGLRDLPCTAEEIATYLVKLGEGLDMLPLATPFTHLSEKYGWSAWMHWETSGVHFYSWDKRDPVFFSVDIYTCKKFDPEMAVRITGEYFKATQIVSKEVTLV
jgi:S-adenosylmethionine decarboxylase